MKIYLAGGMRSGWQDNLIKQFDKFTFIDPRTHGLTNPSDYTSWDLHGIKSSDFVFAYLEKTNPSGMGLAFEAGYAVGIGKPVLFVDEKHDKYADMIRAASHKYWDNFVLGYWHLKALHDSYSAIMHSPLKDAVLKALKEECRIPTSESDIPRYNWFKFVKSPKNPHIGVEPK
jgi:hypothetical protein